MTLPLDDLSLLDGPGGFGSAPAAGGAPLRIALDLIDEDPDQPRREFDESALRELAETIALRGVRQPVSVRPHPREAGRWMLNFGARRYRASRLAGQATIPAFVDATADSFDQVIENEQRERLTPLELALFVQRQRQSGLTLAEIARRLGKTRGYLTFVGALIDPPPWLLSLYRSGACTGMTELYELRKLHEQDPARVETWLQGRADFSRGAVADLKVRVAHEPAAKADADLPTPLRRAAAHPRQATATHSAAPTVATSRPSTAETPRLHDLDGDSLERGKPAPESVASLCVSWQSRRLRIPLATHCDESGRVCIHAVDDAGARVALPVDDLNTLRVECLVFNAGAV